MIEVSRKIGGRRLQVGTRCETLRETRAEESFTNISAEFRSGGGEEGVEESLRRGFSCWGGKEGVEEKVEGFYRAGFEGKGTVRG